MSIYFSYNVVVRFWVYWVYQKTISLTREPLRETKNVFTAKVITFRLGGLFQSIKMFLISSWLLGDDHILAHRIIYLWAKKNSVNRIFWYNPQNDILGRVSMCSKFLGGGQFLHLFHFDFPTFSSKNHSKICVKILILPSVS